MVAEVAEVAADAVPHKVDAEDMEVKGFKESRLRRTHKCLSVVWET